jgi:uncharacterized repeat protein (TIGR01451 family)
MHYQYNVSLWATVYNGGASRRYCLYVWADLINLDTGQTTVIKGLVPSGDYINPGYNEFKLYEFSFEPGTNYELNVHLVSWTTSASDAGNCQNTLTCQNRPTGHCSRNYKLLVAAPVPNLLITKAKKFVRDPDGNIIFTQPNVGDKITYEYVVTNTGNTPLTDLTVKDVRGPPPGVETQVLPLSTTSLPNFLDKATGTYEYTVGVDDVCHNITNYAIAEAKANICGLWKTVTDTSNIVTVEPLRPRIIVGGPVDWENCEVNDVMFEVATTQSDPFQNGPFSYQWEVSCDGGNTWAEIEGATSNPYVHNFYPDEFSYNYCLYRVNVTGKCDVVTSNSANLTLIKVPNATISGDNVETAS